MSITIFGACLVIFSIYILIKNTTINFKRKANYVITLCIVACTFLDLGYVFKVGNFECEYNYLLTGFAFVLVIIAEGYKKNISLLFVGLIAYIIAVVCIKSALGATYLSSSYSSSRYWDLCFMDGELDVVYPSVRNIVLPVIRLIMLGKVILYISRETSRKELLKIGVIIQKCSSIYLVLLVAEAILINFTSLQPRAFLLDIFGHSSSTAIEYKSVFGLKSPMGLAREPSNLAITCLISFTVNIYVHSRIKKGKVLAYNYLLVMILSGSMSAVMYAFACLLLIYLNLNRKAKRIVAFVVPAIVVFFILISYRLFEPRFSVLFREIGMFGSGIASLSRNNSTITRMYSIYNNLYYFIRNPILGTGLGTMYCYSTIVTMLSNLGMAGAMLFFTFYKRCVERKTGSIKRKLPSILWIAICFLVTGHIGHILYYVHFYYLIMTAMLVIQRTDEKTLS